MQCNVRQIAVLCFDHPCYIVPELRLRKHGTFLLTSDMKHAD